MPWFSVWKEGNREPVPQAPCVPKQLMFDDWECSCVPPPCICAAKCLCARGAMLGEVVSGKPGRQLPLGCVLSGKVCGTPRSLGDCGAWGSLPPLLPHLCSERIKDTCHTCIHAHRADVLVRAQISQTWKEVGFLRTGKEGLKMDVCPQDPGDLPSTRPELAGVQILGPWQYGFLRRQLRAQQAGLWSNPVGGPWPVPLREREGKAM